MIALPVASIFTQTFLTSLVAGGLLAGVPLMFTALGEQISEASGVLNIGLEGMMLTGAYTGFLGAYYGHSRLARLPRGDRRRRARVADHGRLLRPLPARPDRRRASRSRWPPRAATSVLQGAQFGQVLPAPAGGVDGLDPAASTASRSSARASSSSRSSSTSASRSSRSRPGCSGTTRPGLNLRAAGQKPQALDAAGVSVVTTRSLRGDHDRRARRASAAATSRSPAPASSCPS